MYLLNSHIIKEQQRPKSVHEARYYYILKFESSLETEKLMLLMCFLLLITQSQLTKYLQSISRFRILWVSFSDG